jgi:molybdate transport system substrate-binding protein
MFVRRALSLLLALALLIAPTGAQDPAPTELVVFAAASLNDAFTEIGAAFEAANPSVRVLFSFAGSSDLATQLGQGAPADVFASANLRQMTVARAAGRIGGTPQAFVLNRLALITPSDNPAGVQGLADLANDGLALVLASPEVPVRGYTDTVLARFAADPAYGQAYLDAVAANVVSEEPNVRLVAAKIALGEADAGVVYRSDITPDLAPQVQVIALPAGFNVTAIYPIAMTDDTAHPERARAFIDFVRSAEGQDILARWGFTPNGR